MTWTETHILPPSIRQFDGWTVYGLVLDYRLIYVGCTQVPQARLVSHRCTNFPTLDVRMVVMATYENKEDALESEASLISLLKPEANFIKGTPKMIDREKWLSQWTEQP